MDIRAGAVFVLLVILAAPGAADYLQAVVANTTTGVATFNSTVASGNTSWILRHAESGATPASQAPTVFTNAVGLTANYGNTYGNLTGNFTWTFWLNVSSLSGNNTTWVSESKESSFQIVGPPAPTPTPTPPPPPPSTGNVTLYLSSPEFGVVYTEVLPVVARVGVANGTSVSEVRMAIENAPSRAPPAGGTACDAMPTGWRVASASSGDPTEFRQQWNVNSSTLPLAPGEYTVYVRAQNNIGQSACAVVPSVPIKVAAATPAPATKGGEAAKVTNVTVEAASCAEKPCQQGIRGPMEKNKMFTVTLSAEVGVAWCGPTDCEIQGVQRKPGYTPRVEGGYCLKGIDPATQAIAGALKFPDGSPACWQTSQGYYGAARRAPGLADNIVWPIADPKQIPCEPIPGYVGTRETTDERGAVVKSTYTVWTLKAGLDPVTLLTCSAVVPVFWKIQTPTCALSNRSQLTGLYYSRGRDADGNWLPWNPKGDVRSSFGPVPILCTGHYNIWTLDRDSKPDEDPWVPLASFDVVEGAGWDWVMWVLILLPVSIGIFVAAMVGLNGARTKHIFKWRTPRGAWVTEGGGPTGDGVRFEVRSWTAREMTVPDPEEVEKGYEKPRIVHPQVVALFSVKKPRPWSGDKTTRKRYRALLEHEFNFVPQRSFPLADRLDITSRPGLGMQKLLIGFTPERGKSISGLIDVAQAGEVLDGYAVAASAAMLEPLARELKMALEDDVWRSMVSKDALRDAALGAKIRGAGAAAREIDSRASDASGDASRGTGPQPRPREDEGRGVY